MKADAIKKQSRHSLGESLSKLLGTAGNELFSHVVVGVVTGDIDMRRYFTHLTTRIQAIEGRTLPGPGRPLDVPLAKPGEREQQPTMCRIDIGPSAKTPGCVGLSSVGSCAQPAVHDTPPLQAQCAVPLNTAELELNTSDVLRWISKKKKIGDRTAAVDGNTD